MKNINVSFGFIVPRTLLAGAFFGLLALTGVLFMPESQIKVNKMYITPSELKIQENQDFQVDIMVSASESVNAFNGILVFDEAILSVESIDYNTSIANLWAQEPWFNKGAGTISFTGGSTQPGGFMGTGSLLQIKFRGKSATTTKLELHDVRILKHDGLGSDATVETPIDALFTIESGAAGSDTLAGTTPTKQLPQDLNGDGVISLSDLSVFMLHLATNNLRSDFNSDQKVNTSDMSILLNSLN